MGDVTELLDQARTGGAPALDRLYELLYADLRRLAHARLRGNAPDAVLDTTSLVHESYLRLLKLERLRVEDRAHFMAYAARAMRSVVVDLVRERQAGRRGGGERLLTLDTAIGDAVPAADDELLKVHEALAELAQVDERLVQVVEMRYFVGLDMAEIATALGVAKRTVERDWEKARSFLYASLRAD
jgi:RNA polymerase sigma factor (TIGR02999 family)